MNHVLDSMLRPVTRWAEHSQQQACRNAMVASTALAEVRAEWDDAQGYVEATLARRADVPLHDLRRA